MSSFGSLRWRTTIAIGVALMVLVGCDSSSDLSGADIATSTTTTTTAGNAQACADLAALKASLTTLADVEPLQDGLNALNAAVAQTTAALETAIASATAELTAAVEQVRAAFAQVQASVNAVTSGNLRQTAPAIAASLRELETAARGLATTVTQRCPGS